MTATDERIAVLTADVTFERINHERGRPVDLSRVWAAFDELAELFRDAVSDYRDDAAHYECCAKESESDKEVAEEEQEKAEKELATLEIRFAALEDELEAEKVEIDRLTAALEAAGISPTKRKGG